jgi:nucleotide-binding universal stress UspA family protein
MFSKVLVATDLSPASDVVLDCLDGLQPLGTREVTLLHVIFVHLHYPETYDTEEAIKEAGRPKLEEQTTRLKEKGFKVTAETAVGRPAKVIAQFAAQRGMSLIVVGSHGASMQRDALLGSVTTELLHKATSPLLLTLPPRTSPVPMLVHTGSGAEKGGICHGPEASHSGADHQPA